MNSYVSFFLLIFGTQVITGCATKLNSSKKIFDPYKVKMSMEDKSGKFEVVRESGRSKNSGELVTKYRVYQGSQKQQVPLEQSIVFSTTGIFKKNTRLLRPEKSQYKVWFGKKLYMSETSVDKEKKSLRIKMKSPESQWNGEKIIPFPGGNGMFCYFSQLVDCIKYTGFIDKAKKVKGGRLQLHVIWDGYPYFQEQYDGLENSPFSSAIFEYDGQTDSKDFRFSLTVSGNVIFYLFNDKIEYAKVFWPSQGYSLYHN